MLRNELQKYCNKNNFNLGQSEIDYLQHLFLMFLAKTAPSVLIFKGGTALQKAYGLNRFSIDLDFTSRTKEKTGKIMEIIRKRIEQFGYPTTIEEVETIGETFIFKISGPLSGASPMSIARLQIEISFRESILLPTQSCNINPIYDDLHPYLIEVMAEQEILAEKVRAIMTRNKPRDVFDLYFLLQKGIQPDRQFINQKLTYYNEQFDREKFLEKVLEKEKMWINELKDYCRLVPEFKLVFTLIQQKM